MRNIFLLGAIVVALMFGNVVWSDSGGDPIIIGRPGDDQSTFNDCMSQLGYDPTESCTEQTAFCTSCFNCCNDAYNCQSTGGYNARTDWEACIGLYIWDKVDCGARPDDPPDQGTS